jgi:hypothetical protein
LVATNGSPVLYDHTGRAVTGPAAEAARKYDALALPQVLTFQALMGAAWNSYWKGRHDEALAHDEEFARAMRHDLFTMGLLQERQLASVGLKWHLEVDNERDKWQKLLKEHLTKVARRTPRLYDQLWYLSEATWYGRYASQVRWAWKDVDGTPSLCVADSEPGIKDAHMPVEGDKIGHDYNHRPWVNIYGAADDQFPGADIQTTGGDQHYGSKRLVLRGSWRQRFIIHYHRRLDQPFLEWWKAEAVHGIGIRDVLHWWEWVKMEWIGNISDWAERAGLGIRLWYYPAGNDPALQEAKKAAKDNARRVNVMVPVYPDMQKQPSCEWVDVATGGPELLLKLVEYIDRGKERFVVGQHMSSGRDDEGSLGGTGRAMLAADTKSHLTRWDALNLAETLTSDKLDVMKRWTFPWAADIPCRWVFEVDDPDKKGALEAVGKAVAIGVSFKEDEVRGLTGLSDPAPGDPVVGGRQAAPVPAGEPGQAPGEPPGQGQEEPKTGAVRQLAAATGEVRKFSSTQFDLPPGTAAAVRRLGETIPEEDLAGDGREGQPHVTVKYGLHTSDPELVRRVVEGFGPVEVRLGKTSLFPAEEASAQRGGDQFDVVKVDVGGDDLRRLNALISGVLAHSDSHPVYKPHATVAYVKPGLGSKYEGNASLEGTTLTLRDLVFSARDGSRTVIPLAGAAAAAYPVQAGSLQLQQAPAF